MDKRNRMGENGKYKHRKLGTEGTLRQTQHSEVLRQADTEKRSRKRLKGDKRQNDRSNKQ